MKLVDWMQDRFPGALTNADGQIKIRHASGEVSTLWENDSASPDFPPGEVRDFYEAYDGADLFSSTFKIASISSPRMKNAVKLLIPLEEFQDDFKVYGAQLPEPAAAFMYQAGIGIYSLGLESGTIYEFDTETGEITEFESLTAILDEWWQAVADV